MRISALLLLLALAGCTANPAALGITGPRGSQLMPQPGEGETSPAETSLPGERYAPSMLPTTNGGRYWGYD